MPNFAANLSFMFNEWDFLDRFQAAAEAGFTAVEYLFPYDYAPGILAAKLRENGLRQVLFNLPPGDWQAGERGLAALSGRTAEFSASVARALDYAEALGVQHLHVMAGLADSGDPAAAATYRRALEFASEKAAARNVMLLIEPINGRDMPGYFLNRFDMASDLIAALGRPNLKLQFDVYHRQIIQGDVLTGLRALLPLIGHVQIAAVPARNEPGSGELDDFRVLNALDALGYTGFVGLEYRPAAGTLPGLAWRESFAASQPISR